MVATNGRGAIGYIRRSSRVGDGGMSAEMQEAAVREMAARYGIADLELVTDWGRSGAEDKRHLRAGWVELHRRIGAGTVSIVFGYAADRMGRSLLDLLTFYRACEKAGTKVVYHDGGEQDFRTPEGALRLQIMGSIAEYQRAQATEKMKAAHRIRRERGERVGRLPYGSAPGQDPALVIATYREAGSLNGTARLLNAAGIPSALGRSWSPPTIRLLLDREAPGLLPRKIQQGSRQASTGEFVLFHLLRCPAPGCGHTLTANRLRSDVIYRCQLAETNPRHPRPYRVAESAILPWVVEEIAHIDLGGDQAATAAEDASARATLAARLERFAEMYGDGTISRERLAEVKAEVETALDALTGSVIIADLGYLDDLWTMPPADTNRILRAILTDIKLGPDMRPVSADWRNRALRRDCDDPACTHCPARP